MKTKNRVAGLDVIRTTAISLVIFGHCSFLFNPLQKLPVIGVAVQAFTTISEIFGYFGVELFFVLSGFLISNILFSIIDKSRNAKETITAFLYSRWLRTLPNYFLFIILNCLLFFVLDITLKFDPRFLLFLQNFLTPHPDFFKEAWSLSVEEWFYFLFVLLSSFLTFTLRIKKKLVFPILVCLFILTSLFIKGIFIYSHINHHLDYDEYFRKIVVFRFDAVAIGVLGFWLSKYYFECWNKLKMFLFIVSIILIPLSFYFFFEIYKHDYKIYKQSNTIYVFTAAFYTLIWSLLILSMFPYLNSLLSFKSKKLNRFFAFFSKISYSLYLCNIPLLSLFKRTIFIYNKSIFTAFINILLYIFILISLSHILYTMYEKRFLAIREKLIK